jgi:hypothetical protein
MKKFKEVPDWWFLVVFLVVLTLSLIFCRIFPLDIPEWTIFISLAVKNFFCIPLAILTA